MNHDLKMQAILNAISIWEYRLENGSFWWDNKEYEKSYCIEQIRFFKEMKLNFNQ